MNSVIDWRAGAPIAAELIIRKTTPAANDNIAIIIAVLASLPTNGMGSDSNGIFLLGGAFYFGLIK